MPKIKLLVREYSGEFIKETDEMILVGNGDDTATWFSKALIEGETRNPHTGVVCFRASKLAAVRSVRLK